MEKILVSVEKRTIGTELQDTVNARDLWKKLQVGCDFSSWVKRRIAELNMLQGYDYEELGVSLRIEGNSEGRPKTEYILSLNAAEHFAMLEKNEIGRQIRQYFIDVEKEARKVYDYMQHMSTEDKAINMLNARVRAAAILKVPEHIGLEEAVKEVAKQTGVSYDKLLASSPAMNNIKIGEEMLEPTECGARMDPPISGIAMNKKLEKLGLQSRIGGCWVPTDNAEGMYAKHAWKHGSKEGYNLKWNFSKIKVI